MTENLRLKNKTLTSTDTDIPSGTFSLPNSNWLDGVTNTWRDTDLKAKNPYVYDTGSKEYGVLYNGDSAFAVNGSVPITLDQSICPKGWTLPTKTEVSNLYQAISRVHGSDEATMREYIVDKSFKASAAGIIEYRSSSPKWVGEQAFYWLSKSDNTSSNYSASNVATFYIYPTFVQLNTTNTLGYISGGSIRCIARE